MSLKNFWNLACGLLQFSWKEIPSTEKVKGNENWSDPFSTVTKIIEDGESKRKTQKNPSSDRNKPAQWLKSCNG